MITIDEFKNKITHKSRLLGLDLGSKRIGVAICDHTPIQAEQCALLTHINGKCDILRGEISELKPFQEDPELYGLNVQIL